MEHMLRYIKIGMVASVALFFSMVSFSNITDFQSNWQFVQHVMSMDTTFHSPALMWRAVTNQNSQLAVYCLIIAWETITAITCWIGCFIMLAHVNSEHVQFHSSKSIASLGVFFSFLLYMVGFIIIAGEWFSMWQSTQWNGQASAGLFLNFIFFTLIFLQQNDRNEKDQTL
jgi:predicted small integral membrane protein